VGTPGTARFISNLLAALHREWHYATPEGARLAPSGGERLGLVPGANGGFSG